MNKNDSNRVNKSELIPDNPSTVLSEERPAQKPNRYAYAILGCLLFIYISN
jgi:hypothetical protein